MKESLKFGYVKDMTFGSPVTLLLWGAAVVFKATHQQWSPISRAFYIVGSLLPPLLLLSVACKLDIIVSPKWTWGRVWRNQELRAERLNRRTARWFRGLFMPDQTVTGQGPPRAGPGPNSWRYRSRWQSQRTAASAEPRHKHSSMTVWIKAL